MAALDGMRVLDMTQYEAGTSCTQALAWMGADVVKVEAPGRGDPGRGPNGNAEYFIVWNSNKRSVAIDLKSEKGRELFLDLVPKFDVFVENYGPGVIEKLDLTYDVMRARNPDIIYARLKGFGLEGPWSDFKCYDMVAQAAAGAFSITGEADGPPMRPGPTMGDAGTGVQMALAICGAYIQKLRTGHGQFIELSMQEAMTYYLRTSTSGGRFGERPAGRSGNGGGPYSNLYPCKGDGPNDYLFVMAVTGKMAEALLGVVGNIEDVGDSGERTREETMALIREKVTAWTRERTKYDAMRELAEAGVPASAVLTTQDLYTNPHLVERGFVHEVEHPIHGTIKLLGWPVKMSESEVSVKPAPQLGEHTSSVLAADLGLTNEAIDQLARAGIVNA
ncbi:MAG: CoA transferase [Gammaproteobacteria bacterium]|nr:CoA transferase [Gammaproteobacteria bacterium]